MKKLLGILLALALLLSCAAFAEEPAAPALQKNLVILFTSDVHCGIDQGWGYAGLYAIKEYLAKDNHVLLVDDGDAIQGEPVGTMTKGEAIVDIMNAVGYDIAIPGNHEFDYGMDNFLELTKKASYPYLSCNFNKDGELIFQPWTIKEFDGVKIGFVGVTTPMTLRSSTPRYFQDAEGNFIYNFMQDENGEAVYAAVQKAVDEVRAEGAAYVVVLAHMGNEAECSPWRYDEVIAATNGIDIWLDGHSHDTEQVVMKNKDGKPVPRSACGTNKYFFTRKVLSNRVLQYQVFHNFLQIIIIFNMLKLLHGFFYFIRRQDDLRVVKESLVQVFLRNAVAVFVGAGRVVTFCSISLAVRIDLHFSIPGKGVRLLLLIVALGTQHFDFTHKAADARVSEGRFILPCRADFVAV